MSTVQWLAALDVRPWLVVIGLFVAMAQVVRAAWRSVEPVRDDGTDPHPPTDRGHAGRA